MTKFIIDVAWDGDDTEYCNEDAIHESLRDYGFYVNAVERIEEAFPTPIVPDETIEWMKGFKND